MPLAKLDDNAADAQAGNGNRQFGVPNQRDDAADDAGEQEGDIKRVPIVDINAAQDADEIVACAILGYSKEQARPLSVDQQWMNTSSGLTMSMSKKTAMGKLISAERIVSFTANAQVTSTTAKELVTTAIERVDATATDKRAAAATVEELIATTKMRVDPAGEQVTTADGMITATTSPKVIPDSEDKAQGMSAAPIM